MVHGFPARCCLCGQRVRPGEWVAWGKAWQPETVHHLRCQAAQRAACA